ncbi:MAG: hypothetical protein ACHQ1H_12325 [Nitrososphaerales archaeon]
MQERPDPDEPDFIASMGVGSGVLYSFILVASAMIIAALVFLPVFWIFALFALVDGLATQFRVGTLVSVNRIAFVFVLLLVSSVNFGVLSIILESLVLIAVIDISFLLRELRQHTQQDLIDILSNRLRSYIYTIVPAGIFSSGILNLAAAPVSSGVSPNYAISMLGLSSAAAFLIVLFVIRAFRSEKSSDFHVH